MNFSLAIVALNLGKKVQRKGWNGKGMFIFKTEGREIELEQFGKFKNGNSEAIEKAREIGTHKGDIVKINAHIDMVCADGSITVGWLASQTDMLADDWQELSF